jgi:hypothetical protein
MIGAGADLYERVCIAGIVRYSDPAAGYGGTVAAVIVGRGLREEYGIGAGQIGDIALYDYEAGAILEVQVYVLLAGGCDEPCDDG